MFAGNGQNIFYFTRPTKLGPTTIDVLKWRDEIKFMNACETFETVSVK